MQFFALFLISKTLHKESAMCTHCSPKNLPLLPLCWQTLTCTVFQGVGRGLIKTSVPCPEDTRHTEVNVGEWPCGQRDEWVPVCVDTSFTLSPIISFKQKRGRTTSGWVQSTSLHQKLQPMGQIWPIASFINKVLMEHGYAHWFGHCLCLFSCYSSR